MKYIPLGKLLIPQLENVEYLKFAGPTDHKDIAHLYYIITKRVGKGSIIANQNIQISASVTTYNGGTIARMPPLPSSTGLISESYKSFLGRKAYRSVSIQRTVGNQTLYSSVLMAEDKTHIYVFKCTAPENLRKPATQLWEQFLKQIKENPTP